MGEGCDGREEKYWAIDVARLIPSLPQYLSPPPSLPPPPPHLRPLPVLFRQLQKLDKMMQRELRLSMNLSHEAVQKQMQSWSRVDSVRCSFQSLRHLVSSELYLH